MSKSRLEKFLYALYSLDSSDLPTPLSRIEELYKCWVTGEEAPTFKPLSRVEKYLMAILGVYDVDSLPNPLSRVEVLLYKLATGDDNLDDIKSFLSEHEELLADIIRNGGTGGNIDIEYVLYTLSTEFNTLYNTAEKPVKSAILSGQTLVNSVNNDNWVQGTGDGRNLFTQNISIKKGQTYTVIGKIESSDVIENSTQTPAFRIRTGANLDGTSLFFIQQYDVVFKQTFTNNENDTIHLRFFNQKTNYKKLMIIEGDYTNVDIPYFEGMQSVKMPVLTTVGKNLFDKSTITEGMGFNSNKIIEKEDSFISDFIKVRPNTAYTMSGKTDGSRVHIFDKDKNLIYYPKAKDDVIITTPNDDRICYMKINGLIEEADTWQLEEGTPATPYEPYKSNILSTSEDVILRGIDDVQDTLDCLTGEVTERIGEVVLDGSEGWDKSMNNTKLPHRFICANPLNHSNYKEICDSFKTGQSYWSVDTTGLYIGPNHKLVITFKSDDDRNNYTVAKFKQYLSENPITIQYHLKTESVKTVDLSVVDQDGNDNKLKSFSDITHVTLSSEGLIPEAELEVATKNEEVLNTMSLEMDDISTTQNTLEETSNIQSENVDSTMIATTEIYEELL